ncbi:VOC family protein [Streptomyces sp. WAC00276]|nr:VOC family protein [Streptomyces sp. WAC00276]
MPATETVPAAYRHAVVPHLLVDDADAALAFYERAFGAEPRFRLDGDEGEVVHAELTVAGAVLMLGDARGDLRSPAALGATPVILHVYVPDVDALTARATAAGAELLEGPADQFHGDRTAMPATPSATCGSSSPTWKISPRNRSRSAWPRPTAPPEPPADLGEPGDSTARAPYAGPRPGPVRTRAVPSRPPRRNPCPPLPVP